MKRAIVILLILLVLLTGCDVVREADTVDLFGAEAEIAVCTTPWDICNIFGCCDVKTWEVEE